MPSLIPSASVIQSGLFDPNHSVESFGVLYTEVLDIKYNVLNFPQELVIEEEEDSRIVQASAYNVTDIDFEKLYNEEEDETLKTMHEYFKEKEEV